MRWVVMLSMCAVMIGCKDDGGSDPFGLHKGSAAKAGSASGSATANAAAPTPAAASSSEVPTIAGIKFRPGDIVDVQDGDGDWTEGMVTEISADGYKVIYLYDDSPAFKSIEQVRAATPWDVDAKVQGLRDDNRWYDATIASVNADGTYELAYADGEAGKHVASNRVHGNRKIKRKRAGVAATGDSGGGGGRSSSSSGPQACVPSHYSRCGNNCFDLQNDRYNCGSCGHSCPSGMGLCNHGRCDCTQYDKDANGGSCPSS